RDRGLALLRQTEEGHGQEYRHGARGSQRRGLLGRRMLQMVAGEGAAARSEKAAAQIRELLGMHLHRHAQMAGSVKENRRLFDAESYVFTEDVNRIHQAFSMKRWQPLPRDVM